MERITEKKLNGLCDYLNRLAGHEGKQLWTRHKDGGNRATVGMYCISHAYGGVSLERIVSGGGAVQSPLGSYHRPKRELYDAMRSYIAGIEDERCGEIKKSPKARSTPAKPPNRPSKAAGSWAD